MNRVHLITYISLLFGNISCIAQTQNKMDTNNSLLCNPENGVCEMPTIKNNKNQFSNITSSTKPVKVIYFTDPICSSCWVIEPQLRKLKLEYGDDVEIDYRMGGLLPDWSYNNGGISKPSDVAHHWDEVSVYYDMPIDGDVWLEDPLSSSYPPSIAFKAAQMQDKNKAILFLRAIREMVFIQKKNITKWENIYSAAKNVGLDVMQFKNDFEGPAKQLFEDDLVLSRSLGVRGFPTLFFTNTEGKKEMVFGSKPYATLVSALATVYPNAQTKAYDTSWKAIFEKYPSLTAKEFSILTNTPRNECESILSKLVAKGHLTEVKTKNGSIWQNKFQY